MDRGFNFLAHQTPARQSCQGNVCRKVTSSSAFKISAVSNLNVPEAPVFPRHSQQLSLTRVQPVRYPSLIDECPGNAQSPEQLTHSLEPGYSSYRTALPLQHPPHHRQMSQSLQLQLVNSPGQDPFSETLGVPNHQYPIHPSNLDEEHPAVDHRIRTSQDGENHRATLSRQQKRFAGLLGSQTASQGRPVALHGNAGNAFSSSSTGTHAVLHNSQHLLLSEAFSRDRQQPLLSQSHLQKTAGNFGISPSSVPSSMSSGQPLPRQQHTMLRSPQLSQTCLGSFGNICSALLPANAVDSPAEAAQHCSTSRSGDTLSGPHPWDASEPSIALRANTAIATQNVSNSVLPLPLGEARKASSAIFNTAPASGFASQEVPRSGALGRTLGTGVAISGASSGNAVMSRFTAASIQIARVGPVMSARATTVSLQANSDKSPPIGKTIKKSVSVAQKTSSSAGQGVSGSQSFGNPIIGPLTADAFYDRKYDAQSEATEHDSNAARSSIAGPRRPEEPLTMDSSRPKALSLGPNCAGLFAPFLSGNCGSRSIPDPSSANRQKISPTSARSLRNASSCRVGKGQELSTGRACGTLPVYLRNPKKGRARVFRECRECKNDNHIRRSDCFHCKKPLPAGKRRIYGNPVSVAKGPDIGSQSNRSAARRRLGESRKYRKEHVSPNK